MGVHEEKSRRWVGICVCMKIKGDGKRGETHKRGKL